MQPDRKYRGSRRIKSPSDANERGASPSVARPSTLHIHAVLYAEGDRWIAQGLQYDIAAQGASPLDASRRLVSKVGAEVAISMDLGREFGIRIRKAPQRFWRLYDEAKMEATIAAVPIRVGAIAFEIAPHMKIADRSASRRRDRRVAEAA